MKITLINGNTRHGSTWHCADVLLSELSKLCETEVTEFMLPRDMPHFCLGCFSCFQNGEESCPHASSVQPIAGALTGADLVILTSPVYALDVSGQMKALLDHLCYMWMSHRPNPAMFRKVGLTVCTTAGMGLGPTSKTMKNTRSFFGLRRIYSMKNAVSAMKWAEVSEKKKAQIAKQARSLARRIARVSAGIDSVRYPFFRGFVFSIMAKMMKKNTWNLTDKEHWQRQGWLDGSKPF